MLVNRNSSVCFRDDTYVTLFLSFAHTARVKVSRSNQAQTTSTSKKSPKQTLSVIRLLNSIHFERICLHQVGMHSLDMLPDTFFIAIKLKNTF